MERANKEQRRTTPVRRLFALQAQLFPMSHTLHSKLYVVATTSSSQQALSSSSCSCSCSSSSSSCSSCSSCSSSSSSCSSSSCSSSSSSLSSAPSVVVVGGTAFDVAAKPKEGIVFRQGTSNPGYVHMQWGGVGRNMAEALARLSARPLFISAVGDDPAGQSFWPHAASIPLTSKAVLKSSTHSTAVYVATLDHTGEMLHAVAAMDITSSEISPSLLERYRTDLQKAAMVVVDANITAEALRTLCNITSSVTPKPKLWFEPTSVAKSTKAIEANALAHLSYASPNVSELIAMSTAYQQQKDNANKEEEGPSETNIDLETIKLHAARLLDAGLSCLFVTMGAEGVLLAERGDDHRIEGEKGSCCQHRFQHFRPPPVQSIVSVTGAGDSFVGGAVWAILQGKSHREAAFAGMYAARLSLETEVPVSPHLSAEGASLFLQQNAPRYPYE